MSYFSGEDIIRIVGVMMIYKGVPIYCSQTPLFLELLEPLYTVIFNFKKVIICKVLHNLQRHLTVSFSYHKFPGSWYYLVNEEIEARERDLSKQQSLPELQSGSSSESPLIILVV